VRLASEKHFGAQEEHLALSDAGLRHRHAPAGDDRRPARRAAGGMKASAELGPGARVSTGAFILMGKTR
jgi:hypothetical protein